MPKTAIKSQQKQQKQSGGGKFTDALSSAVKSVTNSITYVNGLYRKERKMSNECYKASYPFFIPYYLVFYIYPLIIVITLFAYIFDICAKFAKSKQADFYEDVLKYSDAVNITQVPVAGYYTSRYSITFLIIIILYLLTGLWLFYSYKKLPNPPAPQSPICTYFQDKIQTNLFPSIAFFSLILIILIIDFAVYKSFYEEVGSSISTFNSLLHNHIYQNTYIEKLLTIKSPDLITSNTTKNLNDHINKLINDLTTANTSIKKTDVSKEDIDLIKSDSKTKLIYENIVDAYITYGILKTIEDNAYHTKKGKTIDKSFLTSKNLFLTINKTTNRLININYSNDLDDFIRYPNRCSTSMTSNKTLLDYVFDDCDDIRDSIDNTILSIKKTDGTTSSKIAFVCLLIPLIIVTLIYTFAPISSDEENVPSAVSTKI